MRAEPTKQKTPRPERREITRAVRPKNNEGTKKGNVQAQECRERKKEDPDSPNGAIRSVPLVAIRKSRMMER
jgi:hypothetical protein